MTELGGGGDSEVVGGGAETTAGDDEVDALIGEEAQLRGQVGGPVAADRDVGDVDAECQELSGQHGPFWSAILPVSISVPVTMIPARTLTASSVVGCVPIGRHGEATDRSYHTHPKPRCSSTPNDMGCPTCVRTS